MKTSVIPHDSYAQNLPVITRYFYILSYQIRDLTRLTKMIFRSSNLSDLIPWARNNTLFWNQPISFFIEVVFFSSNLKRELLHCLIISLSMFWRKSQWPWQHLHSLLQCRVHLLLETTLVLFIIPIPWWLTDGSHPITFIHTWTLFKTYLKMVRQFNSTTGTGWTQKLVTILEF